MSSQSSHENLALTAADFAGCGWETVMESVDHGDSHSLWSAFSAAAKDAVLEGRTEHGRVLRLLANVCSKQLEPSSQNEPFQPLFYAPEGRSTIPDDFDESDIAFFALIADDIGNPWLKARLADLVWLRERSFGVKFAQDAIDSYRSVPLDTWTWYLGGRECWERAIGLARSIGSAAGNRAAEIESSLFNAFSLTTSQDDFFAYHLAEVLKDNRLGKDHATKIATKLETLAHEFEAVGNLHSAREYFWASADWFKISGDTDQSTAMMVEVAEGWAKEATAKIDSDDPSHLIATVFYENAIQVYRTIPRKQRSAHHVDERISELRVLLSESGARAQEEMIDIVTPGMDINGLVEHARDAVQGKAVMEAMQAFVNLHHVNADDLRKRAIKHLQNFPLQAIVSVTSFSGDGRVVAKRPGIAGAIPADEDEDVIHFQMIKDFDILVGIIAQAGIVPALGVLKLEHRLRETDFIALARQSPIVPAGREMLFGKGLFAGYDGDFVTAMHFLIPQIEHMVRFHLKQVGVQTTTLSPEGIEDEIGLTALINKPEANDIFSGDLHFTIRALFSDHAGANLRNYVAHGLLDDRECNSVYAVYAWWFALKLVFNNSWSAAAARRKAATEQSPPDSCDS